jgi:superfamily II DNA or RNA helicase
MTKDQLQDEALLAIKEHKRSSVVLGTGSGKTYLALKHMVQEYTDYKKYLVVASNSIVNGWKIEIEDKDLGYLLNHIVFTTYQSLYKQNPDHYDWVYFDECHNLKLKQYNWVVNYKNNILGLTGTYPRENTETYKICQEICPKVYTFKIENAIEHHMLNNYKIYVHELTLDKKPTIETKFGRQSEVNIYNMWSKKIEYNSKDMMLKIMRMKAIQGFETKVKYARMLLELQSKKTLVFTDYTAQADKLCQFSYHSKNKKSKDYLELFKEGKINKLSSVQQLAEGINIPNLEVGIVMHAYANERKLPQKIGRFLRLNPSMTSVIHILCYKDTVDELWIKSALKEFDKTKIFRYDIRKTIDSFQRL